MEQYTEARVRALKKLQIADHMLTQTYPLVNDPKILVSVLENIFLALTNGMASLLHYELAQKNIPDFQDTFDAKYNLFKFKIVDKHNISKEHVTFIAEVKDLIVNHKKSPIEFSRKGTFVICSNTYSTHAINVNDLRKYIARSRAFLEEVNSVLAIPPGEAPVKKNDRDPFSNQGWMDID